MKSRFGEIAVKSGLLSDEKLEEILEIQRNPFELFRLALSLSRAIPEPELSRIMKDFMEATCIRIRPTGQSEAAPVADTQVIRPGNVRVQAVLRKVTGLAALPKTVHQIMGLLESADVRLQSVMLVMQSDPALCTQALRMVNSAFFGMPGKVTTIHMAVVVLGIKGVRQLVISSALINMFKGRESRLKEIWRHSIITAQWSQALARRQGGVDEDALAAGLIHDLGGLLILQYFPDEVPRIAGALLTGTTALDAEREALGLTHADMGAYVCERWKFPPSLVQAMLLHHAPPSVLATWSNLLPLTCIVNAACTLAELGEDVKKKESVEKLGEAFLKFHRLDPEEVSRMADDVFRDADTLNSILA